MNSTVIYILCSLIILSISKVVHEVVERETDALKPKCKSKATKFLEVNHTDHNMYNPHYKLFGVG